LSPEPAGGSFGPADAEALDAVRAPLHPVRDARRRPWRDRHAEGRRPAFSARGREVGRLAVARLGGGDAARFEDDHLRVVADHRGEVGFVGRRWTDRPAVPIDRDDARNTRHGAGLAGAVDDFEGLVDGARREAGPAGSHAALRVIAHLFDRLRSAAAARRQRDEGGPRRERRCGSPPHEVELPSVSPPS
jgi:hypothetical protein